MVDIPPKDVLFKGKVAAGASKFNSGISTGEYGGQINGWRRVRPYVMFSAAKIAYTEVSP
jgi:hypothetical protein